MSGGTAFISGRDPTAHRSCCVWHCRREAILLQGSLVLLPSPSFSSSSLSSWRPFLSPPLHRLFVHSPASPSRHPRIWHALSLPGAVTGISLQSIPHNRERPGLPNLLPTRGLSHSPSCSAGKWQPGFSFPFSGSATVELLLSLVSHLHSTVSNRNSASSRPHMAPVKS